MKSKLSGPLTAIASAVLYALSAPAAKLLVEKTEPIILAGLFYLGSGLGLTLLLFFRARLSPEKTETSIFQNRNSADFKRLLGATVSGGIAGSSCIMLGYQLAPASIVSLLLNFEIAFTAMIAWCFFKESFDRRLILGLIAILAGGVLVSFNPATKFSLPLSSLFTVAGCLFWAIDNNLTTQIKKVDSLSIVRFKGTVSGLFNLSVALAVGQHLPPPAYLASALLTGFICFGLSLTLFIKAMRILGAARSSAYFATEPFVGSILCVLLLGETLSPYLIGAALLMGVGVALYLSESRDHEHDHLKKRSNTDTLTSLKSL